MIAFAWGRAGLGARELARSILYRATGDPNLTEQLSAALVHDVVAYLPDAGFDLDRQDVLDWIARKIEQGSAS